jgi:hypothetical protein
MDQARAKARSLTQLNKTAASHLIVSLSGDLSARQNPAGAFIELLPQTRRKRR